MNSIMKTRSKQKRAKSSSPRLQRKTRLTDDQRSWIKTFGSLADYAIPEERKKIHSDPAERQTMLDEQSAESTASGSIDIPSPLRERLAQTEVIVPGVYWMRGYLRLVLSERAGKVYYLHCNDGGQHPTVRTPDFLAAHRFDPSLSPAALALNLISRVVEGSFNSTISIYRRLIDMAMSKEELSRMSERNFALAYSRIMKIDPPLKKIKPTEEKVDEVMAKLAQEGEVLSQTVEETGSGTPETPEQDQPAGAENQPESGSAAEQTAAPPLSTPTAVSPNEEAKGIGMTTKSKGKKLSGAAAKKKKEGKARAQTIISKSSERNPYREGTKKAKAFDIYKGGGTRAEVLAAIKKTGVTDSTANTWMYFFSCVTATGKQPDWDKKREKKEPKPKKEKKAKAAKKKD